MKTKVLIGCMVTTQLIFAFVFAMQLMQKACGSFISLQLGSTAIGIQTNEGVVLAVEKRVTSVLIEPSSIEKILEVDEHIGK